MLVKLLAWIGDKREIRIDAARRVVEAFDGVKWHKHSFSYNGGPFLSSSSGETRFYEAGEIDAAIERLNKVLHELRA
jgi:hypothetical protein